MHPYVAGLIGIALGFAVLKYRKTLKDWIGDIGWAEKYLGMGGTYTFLILIGILLIIFSIMQMFGGLDTFLGGIFSRLVPGF